MSDFLTSLSAKRVTVWALALLIFTWSVPAFAQGGNVQPPTARPRGYSLTDMASIMGYFNTGPRTGTPPASPFQMLYTAADREPVFNVRPGTMLYVPVVYSDNAPPILGDLPDVTNQAAVAYYYFSPTELGAEYIEIEVDGKVTSLMTLGYPVGAATPLADGGTEYTTVAAFLTPLAHGRHEVIIRARFTGAALLPYPQYFPDGVFEFETTYTVNVN